MSETQPGGDLVRPEGELDPENLREWTHHFSHELRPGEMIALRECWYELRATRTARAADLRALAGDSSDRYRTEWWDDSPLGTRDYFALLPNVERPSTDDATWRFDYEWMPPEPVTIDGSVYAPNDEQRREARQEAGDAVGLPGEGPTSARSTIALREAYDALIERGTLTAREVADFHQPPENPYPEYPAAVKDAGAWMRAFGRPALSRLPGVNPPRYAGDPFHFVGVDVENFETEELDRDVVGDRVSDLLGSANFGGRGAYSRKRRATVRELFETIRAADDPVGADALIGEVSAREIGYASDRQFFREQARDVLASLPGVSVENGDGAERWSYDRGEAVDAVLEPGGDGR